MTVYKPRHPVSWPGAVTRIRGLLGIAAAEAIGRSESLVLKFSDPDSGAEPNLSQAVALDAAFVAAGGGAAPILDVYRKLLADRTGEAPHAAVAPAARFVSVVREIGDIGASVERALADGNIRRDEALGLQSEIAEAVEMLGKMSRDVDALAKSAPGNVSERGGE